MNISHIIQLLKMFVRAGLTTLLILVLPHSSMAANWYVDNASTGARTGTSWANAWSSFASIVWGSSGVKAGDTLYISGGSATKSYSEKWTVGASGTAGNPITITIDAANPNHNGIVNFDMNAEGDNGNGVVITVVGKKYITFNGNVNGDRHIQINNFRNATTKDATAGIDGYDNSYIIIDHLSFTNDNNPVIFTGANTGMEIANCSFVNVRGNVAIEIMSPLETGWDSNKIHHNMIGLCSAGSPNWSGPDGIECGFGTSIYNNIFVESVFTGVAPGQHPDMIQMGGGYIKIYNNEFRNTGDSCLDFDCWSYGSPHDVWIYNNVFHIVNTIDTSPDYFRLYSTSAAVTSLTNIKFMNNTFVDNTTYVGIAFRGMRGNPTASGCEIRNNLFLNVGISQYFPTIAIDASSGYQLSDWAIDYNLYAGNGYVVFEGVGYTPASWLAAKESHGRIGMPSLVSYSWQSANNDFHLTSADTVARGAGTDLSAYFTSDKDGNPRPTGTWDIGAYQYTPSGEIFTNQLIAISPNSLTFGPVQLNTSVTNSFTVQNVGGGTLTGIASLAGSTNGFSLINGGSYILASNQSQSVTLVYRPFEAGTNAMSILFTGGGGATATVSGVATSLNTTPVAYNDVYSLIQGTQLTVAQPGVLGNDSGVSLSAALSTAPMHGVISLSSNGAFIYTPATNFTGTDSFSYQANNGLTNSSTAIASITVTPSGSLFSDSFSRSMLEPWISIMGMWSLTNGSLQGTAGTAAYGYAYISTNWTDYSIEGLIQFASGAYGGGFGGRLNAANGAHYGAWVYPAGSSSVLKLVKFSSWTSWSGTPMQQVSLPAVDTFWHTLKLMFIGSRIQVYYDGTNVIDITDNGFDGTSPFLNGGISVDLSQGTIIADNVLVSSQTSPTISVTPSSQSFGSITAGTTSDRSFTVMNSGGGTLSGSASAVAPFSVLSGSPYSLGAGLSQAVTVRYSPTTIGSNSQGISFTGGSGATATATGSAWLPPVVSAITQNGLDANLSKSGLQVFAGSVVQYSGTAADPNGYPITWQWLYSTNGSETLVQSGTGTVSSISFNYTMGAAGCTFNWKLRVNNGVASAESTLAVGVEAPPPPVEGLTFPSGSGVITAPFVYTNSSISQPLQTLSPALGGRAAYYFTITYPGNYIIQGLVNAPNTGANSFYLNIDAEPEDPNMIWDIPTTSNFEQRVVSWRGNGTDADNQYVPRIFALSQGEHQVIIRCREANAQLQSFRIIQLPPAPLNLRVAPGL